MGEGSGSESLQLPVSTNKNPNLTKTRIQSSEISDLFIDLIDEGAAKKGRRPYLQLDRSR